MAKSNSTNGMNTFMGRAAGLNEYGQIPALAWTPKVTAKTTSYTVLAAESGTIFTTTGATAALTFTLPAISDGPFVFYFLSGADVAMTVTAETVDTMVTFNDLAADSVALSTASEIIGGGVMVVCDGTTLFAFQLGVGGHRQTLSVAT